MAQVTVERAEGVGERDSDGDSGESNSDSEGEGEVLKGAVVRTLATLRSLQETSCILNFDTSTCEVVASS